MKVIERDIGIGKPKIELKDKIEEKNHQSEIVYEEVLILA